MPLDRNTKGRQHVRSKQAGLAELTCFRRPVRQIKHGSVLTSRRAATHELFEDTPRYSYDGMNIDLFAYDAVVTQNPCRSGLIISQEAEYQSDPHRDQFVRVNFSCSSHEDVVHFEDRDELSEARALL